MLQETLIESLVDIKKMNILFSDFIEFGDNEKGEDVFIYKTAYFNFKAQTITNQTQIELS